MEVGKADTQKGQAAAPPVEGEKATAPVEDILQENSNQKKVYLLKSDEAVHYSQSLAAEAEAEAEAAELEKGELSVDYDMIQKRVRTKLAKKHVGGFKIKNVSKSDSRHEAREVMKSVS